MNIGIIGGGPAGATTAEALLRCSDGATGAPSRFHATIFEEKPGWEKPCGGGLSSKAARRYPFVLDAGNVFSRVQEAEFVAGTGEAVRFELRGPLLIYSRSTLNGLLLRRAATAGAQIVCDRIQKFSRDSKGWTLQGRQEFYRADFLVLAAGARSGLRRLLAPAFVGRDFMLTFGYYAPGEDPLLRVQFFENFEGYAWAFPRPDHLSLGICGKWGEATMPELRERLHGFIHRFGYPHAPSGPVFSHVLPALNGSRWNSLRLAGEGWAITGDAAGLVDPLTGEGIYFAMRSGELLARSLREDATQCYPERVWNEFGKRLAFGARLAPRFYRGSFLGKPATTRLVEFCAESSAFMNLLQDLVEGSQSYTGLPSRVYRTFTKGVVQVAARSLLGTRGSGLGIRE